MTMKELSDKILKNPNKKLTKKEMSESLGWVFEEEATKVLYNEEGIIITLEGKEIKVSGKPLNNEAKYLIKQIRNVIICCDLKTKEKKEEIIIKKVDEQIQKDIEGAIEKTRRMYEFN